MTTSEGDHDPATILVVEDDAGLRKTLVATLKAAKHRPIEAANAAEALRWFAHYSPDLVLLDLGLPDRDGMGVITHIRKSGTTPILVLSARDAETAKVEALDKGADDYVTKPFGVPELLARIRAALRHGVQARGSLPIVGVGPIDPKEYDLLAELAIQHGRPVRHSDLLRSVWGSERADLHYLRVYIGQLRSKLEDDPSRPVYIVAEPGVGYRLATA
ncbi:MAG: operon transcriptional regulatory protein KdpE [Pseudomonadota bacterium]